MVQKFGIKCDLNSINTIIEKQPIVLFLSKYLHIHNVLTFFLYIFREKENKKKYIILEI